MSRFLSIAFDLDAVVRSKLAIELGLLFRRYRFFCASGKMTIYLRPDSLSLEIWVQDISEETGDTCFAHETLD